MAGNGLTLGISFTASFKQLLSDYLTLFWINIHKLMVNSHFHECLFPLKSFPCPSSKSKMVLCVVTMFLCSHGDGGNKCR